jgi:regulator of protease activity HflC (stomatin/prohibitin superfamily)
MAAKEDRLFGCVIAGIVLVVAAVILLAMWGLPQYGVYEQRLAGESLLAHAQAGKEVAVAEARAKMESAKLLADADVLRAEGAAQANKIIGDSLKGNEAYLRYLWIQNLENSKEHQVIYIPTEAGLPILEANRLRTNPPIPSADQSPR